MLSNSTRLGLLRRIIATPNLTVGELAEMMSISASRASQELRRLQSRGIVQAGWEGMNVRYRPIPDPLVSSAKPILEAMRQSFQLAPQLDDGGVAPIAIGFSHARRLAMVQALKEGQWSTGQFIKQLSMSPAAVYRHTALLEAAGVVEKKENVWVLVRNRHPLVRCFMELLAARSGRSYGLRAVARKMG